MIDLPIRLPCCSHSSGLFCVLSLRKWVKRYKQSGIDGRQRTKPQAAYYPKVKVTTEDEQRIIDLRDNRKLGHRSIASEMERLYDRSLFEKVERIEIILERLEPKKDDESELLNIEEAATFLKVSVAALYTKVSRNEIPFSKPARRLYFSKTDLKEWIRQGSVEV